MNLVLFTYLFLFFQFFISQFPFISIVSTHTNKTKRKKKVFFKPLLFLFSKRQQQTSLVSFVFFIGTTSRYHYLGLFLFQKELQNNHQEICSQRFILPHVFPNKGIEETGKIT